MNGSTPFRSSSRSPADEHLGDRLAAFVDGELGDDTRERVLAHLATCEQCKAEADEQRRLKSAVAGATEPVLSAGLLARLQGLPGGGPGGPDSGPFDGGILGGDLFGSGRLLGEDDEHSTLPTGEPEPFLSPDRSNVSTPAGPRLEGFRIHDFNRPASRSRRFAFAAAGAFSMAAIALGGALPLDAAVEGSGPTGDAPSGTAATPLTVGDTTRPGRPQPGLLSVPLDGATPVAAGQPLLAAQGGRAPSVASPGVVSRVLRAPGPVAATPVAVPPVAALRLPSALPSPAPLTATGPAPRAH